MGNCMRSQSSRSWDEDVDDEDEFEYGFDNARTTPAYLRQFIGHRSPAEEQLEGMDGEYGLENKDEKVISTEVKIRVTKKQLEELVSVVEIQGMSIEELLKKVASLGYAESQTKHRHWRPALQSIPEVD